MPLRHTIRARMLLNGQIQDVTGQVMVRNPVKISKGLRDESTRPSPMSASLTLRNTDLRWSMRNPLGPYADDLKRNVPIWLDRLIAQDDFDRTSSGGWGTAPTGQTWVHFGFGGSHLTTDYPISGGMARTSIPATSAYRAGYLDGVSMYNVAVECTFQLPTANVTGGDMEPGNILLRVVDTDTYYMVRVVVTAAEAVTVALYSIVDGSSTLLAGPETVAGVTNTGQPIRVKAIIEGQTLQAKVWDPADGEPLLNMVAAHTAHIAVPGSVGVRNGLSSGNTNTLPVVIALDDFAVHSPRFRGEVSTITTGDDAKGKDRHAKIQAYGLLHRLGQGTSPVMSSLKRGYLGLGPSLVAYWPCEDGADSTSIASALGGPAMGLLGSPDFAVNDDFPCSAELPTFNGSGWFGDVPEYDFTGEIQCRFLVSVNGSSPPPDETVLIRTFGEGTIRVWEVLYLTGGGLKVKAFDVNDIEVFDSGALGFTLNDEPSRVSFELENDGADVDWQVSVLRVPGFSAGFLSGTVSGFNCGRVTQVMAGPQGLAEDVAEGHISLESARTDLFANLNEVNAWFAEDAVARLRRLCTENGIAFYHHESAAQDASFMGYQRPLRLVELLRECELTDGGILHEPRGTFGLEYRTRRSLYAQSARVTADVSAGQVGHPFRPVEDDQRTRNDVTAEQPSGTSARAELLEGPLSVQDYPDGIGRIDTVAPVNISQTRFLLNHAEWRLAVGTTDAPRFPGILFDLDAAAIKPLIPVILDLMLGDRLTFDNAGALTGIFDPIHQLGVGVVETWTNHRGLFSVNGIPSAPYDVGELDADARLDSGSSTLNGALSASETGTFSVTSGLGDLWITTATHQPDGNGVNHFPVDVLIGGEKITISGISGASSPQTFTVATDGRGANGVHEPGAVGKAHASGAEVHAYEPFRFGL